MKSEVSGLEGKNKDFLAKKKHTMAENILL